MAKFGFLSIVEEEMDKHLGFDYALDWDKKNHTLELTFVLEAQNQAGVETVDETGQTSSEDIIFEDYVLFYNPKKSRFDEEDYLLTLPYEQKQGFSREFLSYLAQTLNEAATKGLDDLMDFLADDSVEEFALELDKEAFEAGKAELKETTFYPYPRY